MEKLQGDINPCLVEDDEVVEVGCLALDGEDGSALYSQLICSSFEGGGDDDDQLYAVPSLEDNMSLLEMLQAQQGVDDDEHYHYSTSPFFPLMQDPNYFELLKLQHQYHKKLLMNKSYPYDESMINRCLASCNTSTDSRGCVTNCNIELQSPVPQFSTMQMQLGRTKRERKKRKRSSKEEVESQRMTHIAVERNRRRQMNDHLNSLRSLMPPSYAQRGDQASIIGGAIDFVKELEQLLQSLQAQKSMMKQSTEENVDVSSNLFNPPSSSISLSLRDPDDGKLKLGKEILSAEKRSGLADIQVLLIQNHVNLKIECKKRPGQLLKAIVAFDQLRLSVLHLNVTSLHTLVYYSFNLKIEEDCKLGSADEVASAVHQIFTLISIT